MAKSMGKQNSVRRAPVLREDGIRQEPAATVQGQKSSPIGIEQLVEDYEDRHLRLQAEMENQHRRLKEYYRAQLQEEKRCILRRFLTIADNLERALQYKDSERGLKEGLGLIYRQLKEVLAAEGVEEIEAIGKPFDPRYHEVVQVVEGSGEPVVVEEWERGYLHEGKLLRPVKVTVTKS